jgi:putative glutamine amidotransferase
VPEEWEPMLSAVHGLVLTGGEDVSPTEYGEHPRPETEKPHLHRDKSEIGLTRLARKRKLPTLAICRGIQLVNVALGGTLIQDIPAEFPTSSIDHDQSNNRDRRVHDVAVEPDSMLARAVDTMRLSVNSSHHQAIARAADGLRITARSPDGVIEGAEWSGDDWWMLAVQWHPEELVRDQAQWDRGLFKAFAERVKQVG